MTRTARWQATGLAIVALAMSVSRHVDAHDPIFGKVTWTRDISRIFQATCVGCHKAGESATMPLSTYEEARPWSSAIRQQVLSRRMPVWHAARGYGDFLNDPSLSPFDIALIVAWVNAGAPRGDDPPRSPVQPVALDQRAPPPASSTRQTTLACSEQPLSGRLLAISPTLAQGAAAGITALLPNGQREVVAWIRDYDPRYPTTYWLRNPLRLPRGSRLTIEATGACRLTITLAR